MCYNLFFAFKNKFTITKHVPVNNNFSNLILYYQNVRGLKSKLFDLRSNFILLPYVIFLHTGT